MSTVHECDRQADRHSHNTSWTYCSGRRMQIRAVLTIQGQIHKAKAITFKAKASSYWPRPNVTAYLSLLCRKFRQSIASYVIMLTYKTDMAQTDFIASLVEAVSTLYYTCTYIYIYKLYEVFLLITALHMWHCILFVDELLIGVLHSHMAMQCSYMAFTGGYFSWSGGYFYCHVSWLRLLKSHSLSLESHKLSILKIWSIIVLLIQKWTNEQTVMTA